MDEQNLGGQVSNAPMQEASKNASTPVQQQPSPKNQPNLSMQETQVKVEARVASQSSTGSKDAGHKGPYHETMWKKLVRFIGECRRVLKVVHKPNKEEFLTTVKASAIGLAIVGLIGFALSMIQQLIL